MFYSRFCSALLNPLHYSHNSLAEVNVLRSAKLGQNPIVRAAIANPQVVFFRRLAALIESGFAYHVNHAVDEASEAVRDSVAGGEAGAMEEQTQAPAEALLAAMHMITSR